MGSRTQPNKVLEDIKVWISELKKESLDAKIPINDDSVALHSFQEKLEWILLFGLLEKAAILGRKKSYWNFICACFNSSKRSHDGINFVKSVVPLKSSLGRGRAFIRYCLVQKCLADTLQSCFMNQKISRDFYSDRSVIVQEKLCSMLVISLYELNELNFDLSPALTELDISWPKYARKLFTSSGSLKETESFSYEDLSTVSLHSFSSQDEHDMTKYSDSESLSAVDTCISSSSSMMDSLDTFKLSELNEKLSQHNKSLQGEVKFLEAEKLRLETDIQTLKKDYQSIQEKMSFNYKDISNHLEANEVCSEGDSLSSSFIGTEKKEGCMTVLKSEDKIKETRNNIHTDVHSANFLSVKPKMIVGAVGKYSEYGSHLNDNESCEIQTLDSSESSNKSIDNLQDMSMHLSENHIHISEMFLEFKTVIDNIEDVIQKSDITLAVPHILHLRKLKICLEENFLSQFNKSKNFLNINQFVDNCVSSIKSFATKQEYIINSLQEKVDLSIKQNQNLYSKISTLKDLLRSYGFLKQSNEREVETKSISLPLDIHSALPSQWESFSCDKIAHDPILKRIIVPLMPALNSTFVKLGYLNEKISELQFGMGSSQELNNNLITRVQDQGLHLKGVTKELEEAQHLVSVLKTQHRKLQSAEGILKYDLQEKRKLLNRLKQQLENTREDFNLVRIKNSKSEAEWQDLRKEFVQRHKQTSEESGFVDDRGFEEYESSLSNSGCDSSLCEEGANQNASMNNNATGSVCQDEPIKKSRLELLEEQCQNLYSNLLQSSKKRLDIDKRLETMCKRIEKSNNGIIHSANLPNDRHTENSSVNINDTSSNTEDFCQNIISSEHFTNSPQSSSDVGSLSSECSSCMPGLCNDANLSDGCFCDSSKTDSCISLSPFKLQIGTVQSLSITEQNDVNNALPDPDSKSAYNSEYKGDEVMVSSCDSLELSGSNIQSAQLQNVSLSHVDSLLIKKKDLEESLKNLEIGSETASNKKRYLDIEELSKHILELEEENKLLLNKVQDLENRNLKISTELDNITQQLILSKTAKEHEVAAVQFQLNTEVLKYERALKEFSEQNKGLENMKERVTDQEELIQTLEEALTEIRLDRENVKEQQWQELEDIHIALEVREQECISLCQDLEESVSEAEKEKNRNELLLSQLEELKAYNQKDKDSMEAELIHLENDSRDLKKKLVKLLKEKDLLWKRSNHLYHMQKTQVDDRWMNDSEVSSCLGCKNIFSFMLRKHHCRLCGRIFCYSCSNNWLLTASSSKKMRTCNECFMQYMEMKNDVRRGSDVPQIEDDSGEEEHNGELSSFIPTSNSSINSDVSSSITNSVISLPITQKHSTPLFASAPDLRYVIRPEDVSSCTISLLGENVLEESDEKLLVINHEIDKDLKSDEDEISSEECTSVTLEEDIPRTNRLKEISVDEIKALENGLSSKFVIHSGERVDLPILCQTCPIVLQWCLTSSCQSITIKISHTDGTCINEYVISLEEKYKMEDEMELSLPGYYVFNFDNSFREGEVKIQYNLSIKQMSQNEKSKLHE